MMMVARIMNDIFHEHIPVLLNETVTNLVTSPDGIYVDATFGRGSHTFAILKRLSPEGRLIAFDKDLAAVHFAQSEIHDSRFAIFHASYANLQSILEQQGLLGHLHGILFDLGVSSPQLEDPTRGFSFVREGRLDMRMDQSQGITAMDWLQSVKEEELATVIWEYGEERYARRIAKAIVEARKTKPIETTKQLAVLIEKIIPRSKSQQLKHPATRTFQAIRIAINHELTELEQGLQGALASLAVGGRLAVISFHSLEDRIVKQFVALNEKGEPLPRGLPIKAVAFKSKLKTVVKPIKPSLGEIKTNPRSRSAILRISEKVS
jgi:16S rRNA (cytosine1402-N4)-methyltransferase